VVQSDLAGPGLFEVRYTAAQIADHVNFAGVDLFEVSDSAAQIAV